MPNEHIDAGSAWGIGNLAFYRMCFENPNHNDWEVVADKILFISRVYSVSRGLGGQWEPLTNAVVKNGDQLDRLINVARKSQFPRGLHAITSAHTFLDQLTCNTLKKAGLDAKGRASFASKYLHFHAPDTFPILDILALRSLKARTPGFRTQIGNPTPYERYCERLAYYIKDETRLQKVSLRHIDRELYLEGKKRG